MEGTVLSVLDRAAVAGARADSADAGDALAAALAGARAALEDTRQQLPELRAAGVVDAGGKGAVLLLDALHAAVTGGALTEPPGPSGPIGRAAGAGGSPPEPLTFPYEVEFLLEGYPAGDLVHLRSALAGLGDSLAIVGGDALHRVHIHTDRPDEVLAVAGRAGTVRDASTTSLEEQVADCLGRAARGVQAGTASAAAAGAEGSALLAVVDPSEVGDALRSLGALVVDPSDRNAMAARLRPESGPSAAGGVVVLVEDARADGIRERLARNGDGDGDCGVALVVAPHLAAMISAATEFRPGASPADNVTGMTDAAARIRAGELAANETSAVVGLVAGLAAGSPDAEVLTVVVGTDVSPDDLDAVVTALGERFPALRVEALRSGAPAPAYQVGLE